jgi:hypothetical protein
LEANRRRLAEGEGDSRCASARVGGRADRRQQRVVAGEGTAAVRCLKVGQARRRRVQEEAGARSLADHELELVAAVGHAPFGEPAVPGQGESSAPPHGEQPAERAPAEGGQPHAREHRTGELSADPEWRDPGRERLRLDVEPRGRSMVRVQEDGKGGGDPQQGRDVSVGP